MVLRNSDAITSTTTILMRFGLAKREGLAEQVSVTEIGGLGWVAEGKLSYILDDNKGKDPGPFKLMPVALPK